MKNPWSEYEKAKRELAALKLPPKEYEKRLKEIARRLNI